MLILPFLGVISLSFKKDLVLSYYCPDRSVRVSITRGPEEGLLSARLVMICVSATRAMVQGRRGRDVRLILAGGN